MISFRAQTENHEAIELNNVSFNDHSQQIEEFISSNFKRNGVEIKRIVVVPRWSGTTDSDWYPHFFETLKKEYADIEIVKGELCPNKDAPEIAASVESLLKLCKQFDENSLKNTLFIGHSVGCQIVMRTIEALNNEKTTLIGAIALVAAWTDVDKRWPVSI